MNNQISAVIPCLNYSDFLEVTLPEWIRLLGASNIVVVSAQEDLKTQHVCELYQVRCLLTDAWKFDGAVLNKAAALDRGFEVDRSVFDRVCISIDADAYPIGTLPVPTEQLLNWLAPDKLYGCWRYACPSPAKLEQVRKAKQKDFHLIVKKMHTWGGRAKKSQHGATPQVCCGYFQMWKEVAHNNTQYRFGSYPAANEYDVQFAFKFPKSALINSLSILHLGENHSNWTGRVSELWSEAK